MIAWSFLWLLTSALLRSCDLVVGKLRQVVETTGGPVVGVVGKYGADSVNLLLGIPRAEPPDPKTTTASSEDCLYLNII